MTDRLTTEIPADVDILAQPVHFKHSGRTAPNRFLKAAMTERLSTWDEEDVTKRGIPTPELIRVYEEWGSENNFGVILSGNTFGDYINLESKRNAIMRGDEPERLEAFKKMAAAAKRNGALYVVQLSHGGRQVPKDINPYPVSSSDVHLNKMSGQEVDGFGKPTALTKEGIKEIVENFANAAAYAYKTGADGIQLHSAHGYLLAQFLAPSTNKRTDEYGGSLENRSRLHFEILDAIKARVSDPKFILGIKINSAEFQEGGFTPEECRDVCARLEKAGVDFIELSGGTYEELAFTHKKESTKAREAFFLEFADIIRSGVSTASIWVTGGFRTAKAMVEAVKAGSCDGVGLGRPVCGEFDLPHKILTKQAASSRKTLISEVDFMKYNTVCCYQLEQVGKGEKPVDSNNPDELNPVLKKLGWA